MIEWIRSYRRLRQLRKKLNNVSNAYNRDIETGGESNELLADRLWFFQSRLRK